MLPFSLLSNTFTEPPCSRAMGGAGLGLALVDSIAKEHGGIVKVLESSETGSTIALMLPMDNS